MMPNERDKTRTYIAQSIHFKHVKKTHIDKYLEEYKEHYSVSDVFNFRTTGGILKSGITFIKKYNGADYTIEYTIDTSVGGIYLRVIKPYPTISDNATKNTAMKAQEARKNQSIKKIMLKIYDNVDMAVIEVIKDYEMERGTRERNGVKGKVSMRGKHFENILGTHLDKYLEEYKEHYSVSDVGAPLRDTRTTCIIFTKIYNGTHYVMEYNRYTDKEGIELAVIEHVPF